MVFIAYQADLYKEFVLPNTDNSDHDILLDKNIFRFREDIVIRTETVNSEYRIHSSPDYTFKVRGSDANECVLHDSDILLFETKNGERFTGIISDTDPCLEVIAKYDITNTDRISIGESENNDVTYKFNDLVSKYHCEIKKQGNDCYIYDTSTNGVFINSERIEKSRRLSFGEVVNLFGLHIVYLGNVLALASNYGELKVGDSLRECGDFSIPGYTRNTKKKITESYFSRSPRVIPKIETDPIEIEDPPAPKFSKKKPMIYTIGPAFTMAIPMLLGSIMAIVSAQSSGRSASAFMFTGIITAIGSAVIGVIWGLLNMRYARQSEAEEERERFNAYGNYLMEQVNRIQSCYLNNTQAMNSMYPSAQECCKYGIDTAALWNRNRSHKDFLFCRLGIGDRPFQVEINVPKKKFNVVQDSLREKPYTVKKEYETLKNVPVGIDMAENNLFGIVGKNSGLNIVYNIVAQVAANNCYTDVKMIFIYDEKSSEDHAAWEFARWLPHVWSEDKKTRYLAANKMEASDIFYELAAIMRQRGEERNSSYGTSAVLPKPYYILFVQDPALLEGQLISKYVFNPSPEYGITTFIMSDRYTDLPNECVNIIQNDSAFSGIYNAVGADSNKQQVAFDRISRYDLLALAKNLCEVKVNEVESVLDIPSTVDFFEMYGVNSLSEFAVSERWRKNRTFNSMAVLIGKKAGGDNCYLDVHEKFHGPHGLVAGTTGSGKSELLQTYILSLAVNYSPEDIAFFVIDYKGGGMANLFGDLPHMIGQISNLSGNQIRRAMISIKSENRRRQRLFNECGVNNINAYTRLYKNREVDLPIPHLFIIIDEFAELKKEEPEFMREFISVAQVGRSLGVHLILATQKPSGTVDDNIWSNSKFKLCLRVQDRQDSNDMLHKPDAAYISQAGRCYLQVGNDELYELFQSGWSGAVYNESEGSANSDIAEMILNTGKTAIVGSRHQKKTKDKENHNWYKRIVRIAESVLQENGFSDVAGLRDADRGAVNSAVSRIIELMNKNGMSFADSNTNRNSIENFIELYPDEASDADTAVLRILSSAREKGVKLPERKEKSQLEAVVSHLAKIAEREGYNYNLKLWLPVLEESIYLEDIRMFREDCERAGNAVSGRGKWDLCAVVGMYDDPENQAQLPYVVDFTNNGHHAVCGMVVSGKSTFLQTLVYSLICKYTPDQLNLYLLDFSSHMLAPFENAPHCGGVVFDNNEDKLSKFFCMLDAEMNRRKALLGGGDYSQYIRSNPNALPAWVVAIDNYPGFREKTNNVFDDMVLRLAKEGCGYGIYLIVTGGGFGISEIPGRVGDNLRTVISLEMGDKFKYMDVMRTTRLATLPEQGVKGRGLVNVDGNILEFHTALALRSEDDFAKSRMLTEKCLELKNSWQGESARRIPEIPADFALDVFEKMPEYTAVLEKGGLLPLALRESDASVYGIDLPSTYCYSVSGKGRTGKTTALKIILHAASRLGGNIAVFEKDGCELCRAAEQYGAEYITSDKENFEFFKNLKDEFIRRNQIKRSLINEGANEARIFEVMKNEKPIFFFISDIVSFIESVYKPEAGIGDMKGFIENIIEKGVLHNIYFFACVNPDSVAAVSSYQAYKSFVGYKTGVHLGGSLNSQRIFTFQNIPYAEQAKIIKKGLGLVPASDDDTVAERVVIPNI